MFTGIVTDVGEVIAVKRRADDLRRITIAGDFPSGSLAIGASVACAGCCLTVVGLGKEPGLFDVEAAAETLAKTHIKEWAHGTPVNLERPLKVGDELGGHFVSGHVDGLAECIAREDLTDSARMTFRAAKDLMRFIAPKGSIALDGVSLTVNEVSEDTFSVLIIPHTLKTTTLGHLRKGVGRVLGPHAVNLEVDMLARYAARLAEMR
jgi:riboflavin synthase